MRWVSSDWNRERGFLGWFRLSGKLKVTRLFLSEEERKGPIRAMQLFPILNFQQSQLSPFDEQPGWQKFVLMFRKSAGKTYQRIRIGRRQEKAGRTLHWLRRWHCSPTFENVYSIKYGPMELTFSHQGQGSPADPISLTRFIEVLNDRVIRKVSMTRSCMTDDPASLLIKLHCSNATAFNHHRSRFRNRDQSHVAPKS